MISTGFPLEVLYNYSPTSNQAVYDLLSYNYRVKQNIIKALRTEEIVSEKIPPLKTFRQHFMTAPGVQLTLCPISKSMSTVAMNIFCYLYDPTDFVKYKQSISTSIWAKRKKNEIMNYDELQSRIGNKFYRTIAIVRDPLSRFISGYLDKCVRPERRCFGCETADVLCVLTRLKMALKEKQDSETAANKTFTVEFLHMAPQTWYCEMRRVFESLIFVKYGQNGSEHIRMVEELAIALTISRVPPTQIEYIKEELSKSSRTNHTTADMDIRKVLLSEFSTRRDLQNLFWSIFETDYRIFEYQFLK